MYIIFPPKGSWKAYKQKQLNKRLNSQVYKEAKELDKAASRPHRPVEEQPKSQLRKTPK